MVWDFYLLCKLRSEVDRDVRLQDKRQNLYHSQEKNSTPRNIWRQFPMPQSPEGDEIAPDAACTCSGYSRGEKSQDLESLNFCDASSTSACSSLQRERDCALSRNVGQCLQAGEGFLFTPPAHLQGGTSQNTFGGIHSLIYQALWYSDTAFTQKV